MNIKLIFKSIINFIFPVENIEKIKIKKILEQRVFYHPHKLSIFFLPYQNIFVNQAITSLKFRNNRKIAHFFGEILYENMPEILMDLQIDNNFYNPLLITIPISKSRKRKRGYNQSDLIIKNFIKLGGNNFCIWEKNNLIKIKNTKPQTSIRSRVDRLKNPIGSFRLKNAKKLKNKNIILFDDVYTTGSTMKEAKKILKQAGIRKILIVTLAR